MLPTLTRPRVSNPTPRLECLRASPAKNASRKEAPIVFVHGAFIGAWCWQRHFLDYFAAAGYACFAPSLRGHGGSEGGERLDHWGIREYVADLAATVAEYTEAPPILVGHSMGALVVQRYLEQHPATAAVLMAPVPSQGLLPSSLRMAFADPMLFWQYGLMQTMGATAVNEDIARRAVFSDSLSDAEVAAATQEVQRESQRALWDMTVMPAGRPWLAGNPPPMLVMAGSDDALFAPSECRSVAELWGADWSLLEGMAHAMMMDADWRRAADQMLQWLE